METAWYVRMKTWLPRTVLDAMVASGWTAATVNRVVGLADHALATGTALGSWATGRADETSARTFAGERLRTQITGLIGCGAPLPRALEWAAMISGAPTEDLLTAPGLGDEDVGAAGVLPERWLTAWEDAAGPLAPLAWAAGLTPHEARARRAVGTLDPEALRTLAGLRGYRLAEPVG